MEYILLEKNNFYYKIKRKCNETNHEFRNKCTYILSQNPKNEDELKKYELLGEIRNNIMLYKVKYDPEIMAKFSSF